jgi:hypothetical protein
LPVFTMSSTAPVTVLLPKHNLCPWSSITVA